MHRALITWKAENQEVLFTGQTNQGVENNYKEMSWTLNGIILNYTTYNAEFCILMHNFSF